MAFLDFFAERQLAIIVVVTGGSIVVLPEWRLSLLALMVQYMAVALLIHRTLFTGLALVKLVVGALIVLLLHISLRQNRQDAPLMPGQDAGRARFRRFGFHLLRLAVVVLTAVGNYRLRVGFLDLPVPSSVALAASNLAVMGLVTLVLRRRPLWMGLGLLTFIAGFDLLYASLESSLVVAGLMGALQLMIALATSYLIVTDVRSSEGAP